MSAKKPTIALIDGDIIVYRVGFASEDQNENIAKSRLNEFVYDMVLDLDVEDYHGYITASGTSNFRYGVAVTAPYKGQRSGAKPIHYDYLREVLMSELEFDLVYDQEADDSIAIKATELGDDAIICSTDKDFDQVPGWHFNFVKREKYYVSPSDGLASFYTQILTGDRVDNIIGIRGIGPVKARKILDGCIEEQDYYQAVLAAFGGDAERVLENGKLLWLRRSPGQLWSPPSLSVE